MGRNSGSNRNATSSTTNNGNYQMSFEKGTQSYKDAQRIAWEIVRFNSVTRNDSNGYSVSMDTLGRFLDKIKETGGFAKDVAETIDSKLNPYNYKLTSISDRQAWVLAKAAVENGVKLYDQQPVKKPTISKQAKTNNDIIRATRGLETARMMLGKAKTENERKRFESLIKTYSEKLEKLNAKK